MKILAVMFGMTALFAQSASDGPVYTGDEQLTLPANYREWVYLTSGLGMTYGSAGAEEANPKFDNVFVNPSSYRAFLQTGRWPDKTMFILEIRRSVEKESINRGGRTQGEVMAIEAAVKDEKRFPSKWAYFDFGKVAKAAPFPQNSRCNACHGSNAAVENTFVQFYPTLLEVAQKKGTLNKAYVEKSGEK